MLFSGIGVFAQSNKQTAIDNINARKISHAQHFELRGGSKIESCNKKYKVSMDLSGKQISYFYNEELESWFVKVTSTEKDIIVTDLKSNRKIRLRERFYEVKDKAEAQSVLADLQALKE